MERNHRFLGATLQVYVCVSFNYFSICNHHHVRWCNISFNGRNSSLCACTVQWRSAKPVNEIRSLEQEPSLLWRKWLRWLLRSAIVFFCLAENIFSYADSCPDPWKIMTLNSLSLLISTSRQLIGGDFPSISKSSRFHYSWSIAIVVLKKIMEAKNK